MCNTTCNNHSHEEYNVDYIENEQALDITTENVPCSHELNIYIVQDEEDDQCNCNKCSKCEPKKVSCRSLACQQLNDECSCKRKKKKIRKTTMVNVLENNVMRLEDKMNDGCASMHENIEELEDNINKVYNELKDEEARAKLQEAFLHYGLDDAVTRVWYNPEDRLMHFYHKNPANCLNVDVHEGCDCDCCNACGCECKCNYDECQSDIPYTMDENCNIIPMSRDEEELFTIDCRDFIRDIFVNSARLEYDYPGAVDGNMGEGPWLVISYKRFFETDLSEDDINAEPVDDLWIDLSKIWKLENYYDKPQTRAQIKKLKIVNTNTVVNPDSNTTIANLVFEDLEGDVDLGPIKIKLCNVVNKNATLNFGESNIQIATVGDKTITVNMPGDPAAGLQLLINEIVNNMPGETDVTAYNPTLSWNTESDVAKINGTTIKVKMPAEPSPSTPSSNVTIQNTTLQYGLSIQFGTMNGTPVNITMPAAPQVPDGGLTYAITNVQLNQAGDGITITDSTGNSWDIKFPGDCLWEAYGNDGVIPKNNKKTYSPGFYDTTVS